MKVLVAVEPEVPALSETEKLNAWFEEKYEEELQFSPIGMTFLGRKDRYDEIDDLSEAAENEVLAWKAASVEEMKTSFDYEALSNDAKTSFDLWAYQYETALAASKFQRHGYLFDQMNGLQSFLPTFLISFHNVESVEDM